jgi:streptogramin lyase
MPGPNQLLVVDGEAVRSIDLTPGQGAPVTTVWSQASPTPSPQPFAVSAKLVASQSSIYSLDPSTYQPTLVLGGSLPGATDGDASTAAFFSIHNLSSDGTLLSDGPVVRQLDNKPSVTTLAGLQLGAQPPVGGVDLSNVLGATFDDQGKLWLADHRNLLHQIDPVTLANTTFTPMTSPGPSASPMPIPDIASLAWYAGALYATTGYTVQRIDPTSGVATVVAGSSSGYVDDVGTAAQFGLIGYLAIDGQGKLYISDFGNNMIRVLDLASARVSTLAGHMGAGSDDGIGTAASFSRPDQLALDGNGALYVADRGNNVIRKIDLATRAVSRLAGAYGQSGIADGTLDQARFQAPWGLACDGHSLFVTNVFSTGNTAAEAAVRRIDLATGQVSHFVGSATLQGTRPGPLPASLTTVGAGFPLSPVVSPSGDLVIVDGHAVLIVQP